MTEGQDEHCKHVEGLPAVLLWPVEGRDEVGRVDREHPVVGQEEPHEQEGAQDQVDVVTVSVLSPRILVGIIVANDNGFGDQGAHVHDVIQKKGDL